MSSLREQLGACIHCGLCLNACPTYRVTGDEAESPRGRLVLIDALLGDESNPGFDRGPLDRCLGCRNCESVCPSGVAYGGLLDRARQQLGPEPNATTAWLRRSVDDVVRHPRRLAVAATLGRLVPSAVRRVLPRPMRVLLEGLPSSRPRWPGQESAAPERPRMLRGCIQGIFQPEVAESLAKLAEACGEPLEAGGEAVCCGALSHHLGSFAAAEEALSRCIEEFATASELVVPSAGCSAHLRSHAAGTGDAANLAARTIDAVEWLAARVDRLRFRPDPRRVVYHPPCHHTHAQGIRDAAPALLAAVPELIVVPLRDAERCCGSAGSWNLQHPDLARAIRDEKLDRLLETRADLVLSANPGCESFVEKGLGERAAGLPVRNLLVYLAEQLA